jgi:hypothetical protein
VGLLDVLGALGGDRDAAAIADGLMGVGDLDLPPFAVTPNVRGENVYDE